MALLREKVQADQAKIRLLRHELHNRNAIKNVKEADFHRAVLQVSNPGCMICLYTDVTGG